MHTLDPSTMVALLGTVSSGSNAGGKILVTVAAVASTRVLGTVQRVSRGDGQDAPVTATWYMSKVNARLAVMAVHLGTVPRSG